MSGQRQRGVALAIVVWFLAAMSLLVAGIVSQSRVDTRMAQTHIAKAKAEAAGDGAIQLMLAALESTQFKSFRGRGVPSQDFTVGDQQVSVHLYPVSGLIDINGASKELLTMLFTSAGNSAQANAQLLASNVVKWRSQPGARTRELSQFRSIEDLLRVDGITRALLEVVRGAVVVGTVKQVGVDWLSAPPSVLAVLAGDDVTKVSAMVEKRGGDFSPNKTLPRGLNPRMQSVGSGNDFRADAIVTVGDKQWLRRRWVSVGFATDNLLPWQYKGTEAVRGVESGGP